MKQNLTEWKREMDNPMIIVGEVNTLILVTVIISMQKTNKEIDYLNITNLLDLTYICGTFQSRTAEYTFLSRIHETFFRIHHWLGHKTNFSKIKKIEIIRSILSNHNRMKLKIIEISLRSTQICGN